MQIGLRLEGGIGDHVLGLRIASFAKRRFPDANLIAYSDAGGSSLQRELAALCADVDDVRSVHRFDPQTSVASENYNDLAQSEREELNNCALILEGWTGDYCLSASRALNVPVLDILSSRPTFRLAVPAPPLTYDKPYVVLNCSKYGGETLNQWSGAIESLVKSLSSCDVHVVYAESFSFPHLETDVAARRKRLVEEEAEYYERLQAKLPGIKLVKNLSAEKLIEELRNSKLFVGVDNGIKHLAWALQKPLFYFVPEVPTPMFALRWMPDAHRAIPMPSIFSAGIGSLLRAVEDILSESDSRDPNA